MRVTSPYSQLGPSLLGHHVPGVPVGPVRVGLADALLVFAVGGRSAPHRVGQVTCGAERSHGGVDTPGQTGRDFLKQPAVAVGIGERDERAVAGLPGCRAADAAVCAVLMEPGAGRSFVKHLAGLDAAGDELGACSFDVGDNQVQVLGGAGRGRRDARAELDRALRARRRELDDAKVVTSGAVGVESPAEVSVELLRMVDIRDGNDNHLELLVHDVGSFPLLSAACTDDPARCRQAGHDLHPRATHR